MLLLLLRLVWLLMILVVGRFGVCSGGSLVDRGGRTVGEFLERWRRGRLLLTAVLLSRFRRRRDGLLGELIDLDVGLILLLDEDGRRARELEVLVPERVRLHSLALGRRGARGEDDDVLRR
jgi:hypothetical protein